MFRRFNTVLFVRVLINAILSIASPVEFESDHQLVRRQTDRVNYTNPLNSEGGRMLTIIPNMPEVGEPINTIISGLSDPSVLTIEGFLLWATSVNFGVSCLGNAGGGNQYANLGDGAGNVSQGTGNGDNGVLRWNYYDPYLGTCRETFEGGNHFRWWKQEGTNAYFLACSVEEDLAANHMIALNGYNAGRDELVGNATFTNGTAWEGNLYNTTVEMIPAGVLLNATSDGVNHPTVALPGQPNQDGRVALLTIRQLQSAANTTANFAPSSKVLSTALLSSTILASTFALFI